MLCIQALFAQVPHKMSFQAYLTDSNNMPVAPGTYEITFRIYDAKTDGNKIWEETQTVNVDGSMVNAMLGSTIPLVPIEKSGYLEIQLKDDILSPRQEIGTSMFSLQAHKAVRADIADSAPGYAKLDTLSFYAKTGDIVANTDNQSLSLSGDSLYISNGNGVSLNQFKDTFTDTDTDDQSLRISGDTLYISEGNAVSLASYKDTFTDTDTDDQSLRISGDSLYISEGNAVSFAYYKDNADTQDLSIAGNTISLVDGGSVDVSAATAVVANTAKTGITSDQASAIVANTGKTGITTDQATAITNNTAKVGVPTAYSLPSTDGSSSQVLQTDGSGAVSWATVSGGGADTQDLSISGNTISLVDGGSVDVSAATAVAANTAKVGVPTAYAFPTTDGSGSQVLQTDGSGAVSWATAGSYLPLSGGSLTGDITLANGNAFRWTSDDVRIEGTTAGDKILFYAGGTERLSIAQTGGATFADNISTSGTITAGAITIPNTDGTSGQVLQTNGSGALSWATASGGGASDLDGLSDGLVESNSIYVGNDPSSTSDNASYNIAVGTTALDAITTGDNNVALGYDALTANTTGYENSASGVESLYNNTSGRSNTAMGYRSLRANTSGGYNTASGVESMYSNTTGQYNLALGVKSLRNNTTASYNTALGYAALYDANRTADGNAYNTALGYNAGNTGTNDITTGDQNVLLGASTAASQAAASNQIVIGYNATGAGDNTVQLGNTSITNVKTSGTITAGAITIPNTDGTNGQVLQTDGSGTLSWATASGGGASNVNGLSDGLVEDNSLYIGNDPSSTTSTAQYNVAVGSTALDAVTTGDNNAAVGYNALTSNTTGYGNTAVGTNSLEKNTTGFNNTATGKSSLYNNTTGTANTASGYASLYSNSTGSNNIATGYYALLTNSTGSSNTATGYAALRDNTIGENNTATGTSTLRSNTTGGQNTAFGQGGMVSVTTGSYNSSLGYSAGDLITTGSNNVIIGSGADPSANNATNQIVIGYNATGTGDNTVQLGNTSITDVHTSGDVNAVAFNTSSDKRLKTNIAPLKVALAKVLKLNPVQYEKKRALDAKEYTLNEMGFLAQDVQKILPNVVKEGEDKDKLLSVNYIEIIPVLTKAIQEQQAQIEALQNQLQVLVAMQTQDGNTVESTEGDQ